MINTNYLAYFLGTWLYKGGDKAISDAAMNIVENLILAHDECWWHMAFRIRSLEEIRWSELPQLLIVIRCIDLY